MIFIYSTFPNKKEVKKIGGGWVRKRFFIGIDLGGKEKKTTGICVLANNKIVLLKDVFGKEVIKTINPYLKDTQVIAIDAPLTKGRGKGKMRLFEKFLSTSIFRKEKVSPIPPALMLKFSNFAQEIVKKLEKKGFVLGINLVETFPTLVKKICRQNFLNIHRLDRCQVAETPPRPALRVSVTENQRAALICAKVAFFHSQFKTRWLGYKDGFLFLPIISFWKKDWREKFYQAWKERPPLKYRCLITNLDI